MKNEILDLVLTGRWYDKIERGEKPVEYRACTPHYSSLICTKYNKEYNTEFSCYKHCQHAYKCGISVPTGKKVVRLRRGYTQTKMLFEIKNIHIAEGLNELGAPFYPVFNIVLGNRIND